MAGKKTATNERVRKLKRAELDQLKMSHTELLSLINPVTPSSPPPFLGHSRAVIIVCGAADTSPTNLVRSLAQLGVNGVSFQKTVFDGIVQLGYKIDISSIPDSPDSTLISVVTVIQNARL